MTKSCWLVSVEEVKLRGYSRVRFKVVKVSGVSLLALWKEKKENQDHRYIPYIYVCVLFFGELYNNNENIIR